MDTKSILDHRLTETLLMEEKSIALTYTVTPEDYLDAVRLNMRPRITYRYIGGFLVLICFLGLISAVATFLKSGNGIEPIVVIVGAFVYLLTWYYCILPRRIRKIYCQQKLLHDEITMILTDTGLESKTPHGGGKLAWAMFHKWKKSNKVIIVYQSDVLYNVFPIRAFDKAENVEWFCGILGGKVGSSAN